MEMWGNLAAIVISIVTGLINWRGSKSAVNQQYVDHIEGRIQDLETRIEICEKDRNNLRKLVERLEERTNVAKIIADIYGNIVDWSPEATAMFKRLRVDALGKPVSILIPEEVKPSYSAAFKKLIATHTVPHTSLDVHAIDSNGALFPVHVELSGWEYDDKLFIEARITARL